MEVLDIDNIYSFYKKNLTFYKLITFRESLLLIPIAITGFLWTFLFTHFINHRSIINFSIAVLSYIATIVYSLLALIKINKRLQKKFMISIDISFDSTIRMIRRKNLINFLEVDYLIKTKEQKEMLIKILDTKSQEYKKDSLVTTGIIIALGLPAWSGYISKTMKVGTDYSIPKDYITFLGVMIIAIVILIHTIRWYIRVMIINIFNLKSRRFKEMSFILQEDLLYNYYNKSKNTSFTGNMTIERIR